MSTDPVARECHALCRYLAGADPSDDVIAAYRRLLPSAEAPAAPIDALLSRAALQGRAVARMADVYARFFRPIGPLRRRLTLLLAVLENSPGFYQRVSAPMTGSRLGLALRVGRELGGTAIALALGLVAFGPAHALGGRPHGPAQQ